FGIYGGEMAAQVTAGTLRALATASPTRIETLPGVPTVAEFGYRDYEVNVWSGIFAPANTPHAMADQLADLLTAAMQVPDMRQKMIVQGYYPTVTCGTEFGALLRKQYDDYERIIRETNMKGG